MHSAYPKQSFDQFIQLEAELKKRVGHQPTRFAKGFNVELSLFEFRHSHNFIIFMTNIIIMYIQTFWGWVESCSNLTARAGGYAKKPKRTRTKINKNIN